MKKHGNIFRIDIEPNERFPNRHPTHGWQVRIRRQGKQHTKFFSEAKCGGREEALRQAIAYRDELLEQLPEPDDPARRSAEARSKTGVIGLNYCQKDDGSGREKPYVQLSWLTKGGKRRGASYSVEKWGLRRALWNACVRLHREREKQGEEMPEPHVMFKTAHTSILKQQAEEDSNGQEEQEEQEDSELINENAS